MATFPTTNKTFTTKSNGNSIDASHVNDLQDEVAAIEDGWLNGTARLNAGNSTLGKLSVAGGSTFAGNIAAGSTAIVIGALATPFKEIYCSSLYVDGVPLGAVRAPSARVGLTANVQIPSGAFTGVSWNQEAFDSTAMHDNASNSSRVFLTSSGLWCIGAVVEWNTSTTTDRYVTALHLNDGAVPIASVMSPPYAGGPNVPYGQSVTTLHVATSTADYVTVQVLCNASTGTILSSAASGGPSQFWAYRVSQ